MIRGAFKICQRQLLMLLVVETNHVQRYTQNLIVCDIAFECTPTTVEWRHRGRWREAPVGTDEVHFAGCT